MNFPNPLFKLIMDDDSQVAHLVTRTQQIRYFTRTVKQLLGKSLSEHCQTAIFHQDTLILLTNSPVWATRLRFHAPGLLTQLQGLQDWQSLKTIKIKVCPDNRAPQTPPQRRCPLSATAANCVSSLAKAIEDDALRHALERLARHR